MQYKPALNWKNPKVRENLEGVAKFWLDKGADGLRFDVITLIALPELTQSASLWGTMPMAHTYLKELNKKVLSKYDLLTVGEMPGVNHENAWEYVGAEQKQLETIFQLDIMMGIDNKDGNKFKPAPMDLLKFKEVYENWYSGLYGKGWNSVVLGNHDQARAVSRWGNDKKYWKESGKMLCTFLFTQWGTPYIYEGDEIGMTNCNFTKDEFRDVEAINYYNEQIKSGKEEIDFLPGLLARNRDNARTPMQWNNTKNAGFSTADKTWIKVNPNYKEINVAAEEKDPNSILSYYKKMVKLKKEIPTFSYGTYEQVDPENKDVYAYIRECPKKKFIVVLNFKPETISFDTGIEKLNKKFPLIRNYPTAPDIDSKGVVKIKPYEAFIIELDK